ncbi:MAG: circadian clock KaiB family protein [Opitutaceae bacterium]
MSQPPPFFKFRLYVADDTPNSSVARFNLDALCRAHLPGRHEIEIVDVLLDPTRALADGIFMTPMLVKLTPAPVRQILGTLSQTETVLQALGLNSASATAA